MNVRLLMLKYVYYLSCQWLCSGDQTLPGGGVPGDLDTGSFSHGQTYVALSRAKSINGITLLKRINKKDIIFDNRVLEFIGQKLEKKYIKEIMKKNKITKKTNTKKSESNLSESVWITSDDNKLISLYKRNVPEFVLSKILKKSLPQIRERIILLMKK